MDSIIFDLDGTLWDATGNICTSWNVVLREHYTDVGELKQADFFAQMGRPLADIGRSLFANVDDDRLIQEIVKRCCIYENEYLAQVGGTLYDGLETTLAELSKRLRLFIVSNCQEGYIEAFLRAHDLAAYFEDYDCGGHTGLSKAETIRIVVERNGLNAPIYVGDTDLDRSSAEGAGVPFVWASYGFGKVEKYVAKLNSFTDLLALDI